MKSFNIVFSIISIFLNMSIHSAFEEQRYQELAKFFQKYQCSSSIESEVRSPDAAQGQYFVKPIDKDLSQFSRIINARRLSNFFKEHELNDLGVPEKCLTKDLKAIVAVGVSHDQNQSNPVSLSVMQQLVKMIQATGYVDFCGRNMLRSADGKLQFIHTEDRSFASGPDWKSLTDYSGEITPKLKEFSLRTLRLYFDVGKDIQVDSKARSWLENQWLQSRQSKEVAVVSSSAELTKEDCMAKLLNSTAMSSAIRARCIEIWEQKYFRKDPQLPYNSKYDDPSINFAKVKHEFVEWYAETHSK